MANQRFADLVGHPLETITVGLRPRPRRRAGPRRLRAPPAADAQRPPRGHQRGRARRTPRRHRIWTLSSWSPVPDATAPACSATSTGSPSTPSSAASSTSCRTASQQLANAQRIARLGSWTWDLGADEVWWSPELYSVFDVDPPERGGTEASYLSFVDLLHPDDRDEFQRILLAAINQQDRYTFEGAGHHVGRRPALGAHPRRDQPRRRRHGGQPAAAPGRTSPSAATPSRPPPSRPDGSSSCSSSPAPPTGPRRSPTRWCARPACSTTPPSGRRCASPCARSAAPTSPSCSSPSPPPPTCPRPTSRPPRRPGARATPC